MSPLPTITRSPLNITAVVKTLPIVGIHFRPKEVKSAMSKFTKDTVLYLKQEKDNKFDRYAVKVMALLGANQSEEIFCGYIPATHSQIFSVLMDHDIFFDPYVISVDPNGPKGLEVMIALQLA